MTRLDDPSVPHRTRVLAGYRLHMATRPRLGAGLPAWAWLMLPLWAGLAGAAAGVLIVLALFGARIEEGC